MSDDEHGMWLSYKAYITIPDLTSETVTQALCHEEHDEPLEDPESVHLEIRLGQTMQALIRYHRDNAPKESDIHPKLFLVIDSIDLQGRGVLPVSPDEYHGYNDALRYPIKEGRDAPSSLMIANDGWFTCREGNLRQRSGVVPHKWFSLYNFLPKGQEGRFEKAFAKMNEGVHMLGVSNQGEGDMEARGGTDKEEGSEGSIGGPIADSLAGEAGVPGEDEEQQQPEEAEEEGRDQIYKAAHLESRDSDQIMDGHASYAQENRQDPSLFAVIDEEYETKGPLIVRIAPHKDSFRCKGEVAGEILRWIFVNLMTWDDVKSFASSLG
ncbi:hypothetical protein DL766_001634 [Monosporascus sp. MC13-8B]|uniref:Uncharacterized protein n=1 Tax=Monosporascus cannonballus TaxID=155416 RepID=A0ABY0GZ54_9PEZI|nr:hypothetical protein DL762_008806 [Monosporascus cannonballus]RYO81125.1 hypothetical protein DL763_008670 [Monosporascus cannonballus]RYP37165.1 hypothetical protein DL766_001634 [Monosporascus sp. MC13-8B]